MKLKKECRNCKYYKEYATGEMSWRNIGLMYLALVAVTGIALILVGFYKLFLILI